MRNDRLITLKGFLDAFLKQHQERSEHPFCFILGAGASKQSGIPAGSEMAMQWLREMHLAENFEELSLEEWATSERLEIPGFDIKEVGRFYPQLYSRLFKEHQERGYAFLESQMEGKEPSFGYSVLAYLLSKTQHKIVITTNFDNLVADALSIHSNKFPIIANHDSLANYARVDLHRPLIAKVHGGLGFQPKSLPEDLCPLPLTWQEALIGICRRSSLIVIGYDGNDGSLMDFLEKLPVGIPDTVYWCFRSDGLTPNEHFKNVPERVKKFVLQKKGHLIPIPGFDELMVMLLHKLKAPLEIPDLFEQLKERARNREKSYDDQQRRLTEAHIHSVKTDEKTSAKFVRTTATRSDDLANDLAKSLESVASQRKDKPWWLWVREANSESDIDKQEGVYKNALEALPNDASMLGAYANFLKDVRKDNDKAEEFYKRAMEADPKQAFNFSNYAILLQYVRKDNDRAEEFYKRAIETDPKYVHGLVSYANFLKDVRKDNDKAEELFKRAIEVDPKSALGLGSYANFLKDVRKDNDKAEEFYKRAMEADPKQAFNFSNYAILLQYVRKDNDRAEEFYKRAIETDPKYVHGLVGYANFLKDVRKDNDRAEEFYKRAIETDPKYVHGLVSYANFLKDVHKDNDKAEELFKRAIEVDPKSALGLGSYANFLKDVRKDNDKAEEFYKRAMEADPKQAFNFSNYAILLQYVRKDNDKAEEFYKRAIETDPKSAFCLGSYAKFLNDVRKDSDKAEEFYKQAIEVDPKNARNLSNYAILLQYVRKDDDKAEEFYKQAIEADQKYAHGLSSYAIFLKNVHKDNDKAEEFYIRAIEANSNDASILGNYATFLEKVRKDNLNAEEYYKRSFASGPENVVQLCNYSAFLLSLGKNDKGLQMLDRVFELSNTDVFLAVDVGKWFYAFLHRAADKRGEALSKLRELILAKAARSPGWVFSENIQRAVQDGHPDAKWLPKLADVISEKAEPTVLADWPAWRNA